MYLCGFDGVVNFLQYEPLSFGVGGGFDLGFRTLEDGLAMTGIEDSTLDIILRECHGCVCLGHVLHKQFCSL